MFIVHSGLGRIFVYRYITFLKCLNKERSCNLLFNIVIWSKLFYQCNKFPLSHPLWLYLKKKILVYYRNKIETTLMYNSRALNCLSDMVIIVIKYSCHKKPAVIKKGKCLLHLDNWKSPLCSSCVHLSMQPLTKSSRTPALRGKPVIVPIVWLRDWTVECMQQQGNSDYMDQILVLYLTCPSWNLFILWKLATIRQGTA